MKPWLQQRCFWKQDQLLSVFSTKVLWLCVHHLRNSEVKVSNSGSGHRVYIKLPARVGSEYAGCNPVICYWPSFFVYSCTWDIVLIGMGIKAGIRGIHSLSSSSKCYNRLHRNKQVSVMLSRAWTKSFLRSFSLVFLYFGVLLLILTYLNGGLHCRSHRCKSRVAVTF